MISVLIVILLSIGVIGYVAYPLIFKREENLSWTDSSSAVSYSLRELQRKKETIYLAIKELDFDYKMGKLSEGDYQQLRQQLKTDATLILQQIDELEKNRYGESLEDQIEKEILAFRKKKKARSQIHTSDVTSEVKCPNCHKLLAAQDKFCSECGTRVQFNCESCGQTYLSVYKFCPNCGNKLVSSL
jgi:predicted RNA-binding Zn-ribbon protein involved in translation (DUF1610 family)